MRPSQNLPLPPRIHPQSQQLGYYGTLPESIPPSQNIPPFSTTIILSDPPRMYPSLSEYTPLFNKFICVTRISQNLPLPPRIYPLSTSICDPPRIYPSLPEYNPIFKNFYLYASLPESIPPSHNIPPFNNCTRHSQKLPIPQRIHSSFSQLYDPPPSQNVSLVSFIQYSKNLPLSHCICSLFLKLHVTVRESTTLKKILWE